MKTKRIPGRKPFTGRCKLEERRMQVPEKKGKKRRWKIYLPGVWQSK